MATEESVRIFLGWHVTAQDARAIAEHWQWCDTFVPELVGWTLPTREGYRMVASGSLAARHVLTVCGDEFGEFGAAQLMLMERSGKRIEFADIPDSYPQLAELRDLSRLLDILPVTPQPWHMAIASLTLALERFAQANVRRDAYIADRLCELVAQNPESRILVRLGAAHTFVGRALARRGVRTRVVLQRPMRAFGHAAQGFRYAQYGRPVPPITVARCLLDSLMRQFWLPVGYYFDDERREDILERVAYRFSQEAIQELWEAYAAGSLSRALIARRIADHGFVLQEK
jgi:hypothetical protein